MRSTSAPARLTGLAIVGEQQHGSGDFAGQVRCALGYKYPLCRESLNKLIINLGSAGSGGTDADRPFKVPKSAQEGPHGDRVKRGDF